VGRTASSTSSQTVTSSSRSSARAVSRRRTRFSRSSAASALAALLLLAGCGGDSAHDAFVEDANAVCAENREQVDALASPQSSQQLVRYVDELTRLARAQVRGLRALEPPDDDAAEFERMLVRMEATLQLYPDLREAVETGQQAAVQSVLQRANSSNEEAARSAEAIGLDECIPGDGSETTSDR
jgi:hypothetical protein